MDERRHIVHVGRPMEITHEDSIALWGATCDMDRAFKKSAYWQGGKGEPWILEFMRAHRRANEVLQRIIQRSHAT